MSRQRSGNIIQLLANSGQLPKNTDNYSLLSNKSNERNIKQFKSVIESIINENNSPEKIKEEKSEVHVEKFELPKVSLPKVSKFSSPKEPEIEHFETISLPKPEGLISLEIIRIVLIIVIGLLIFAIFMLIHKFPIEDVRYENFSLI